MENYFSLAHEKGFKWVELSCNNPSNFLDKFSPERISSIRTLKDRYGLRYGIHSPSFVNAAEIEPTVRKPVCQHLIDYLELSRSLEAEYLVLHFGYHFSLFLDEVFRCLIETFKLVVEIAEDYGIPIGIENMNKYMRIAKSSALACLLMNWNRFLMPYHQNIWGLLST